MKGNSPLFSNYSKCYGRRFELNIQLFAKMPTNEAQIKHIMANREGHFIDTLQNRKKLEDVTNDKNNFMGKDFRGHEWYSKNTNEGQIWVHVYKDVIIDGVINKTTIPYIENQGIKKKIIRRK